MILLWPAEAQKLTIHCRRTAYLEKNTGLRVQSSAYCGSFWAQHSAYVVQKFGDRQTSSYNLSVSDIELALRERYGTVRLPILVAHEKQHRMFSEFEDGMVLHSRHGDDNY